MSAGWVLQSEGNRRKVLQNEAIVMQEGGGRVVQSCICLVHWEGVYIMYLRGRVTCSESISRQELFQSLSK
jgi:hypothetical protein